jgi:tetratricopeptide (TPR) repeat protein
MAHATSPATQSADLPTIIIDPSAYEPERPLEAHSLHDNLRRLTRVTLAATLVGTATIGIAHVLEVDSLLSSKLVSALTTAPAAQANDNAEAPVSVAEHDAVPAPTSATLAALAPAQFDAFSAGTPARFDGAPDAPPAAPAEALSREEVAAEATTAATAAAPGLPQTRPGTGVALAKVVSKPASLQDEVRNARRLLALNRLEEAEAAYRKVLALNDGEHAALTGIARVQLARGQLDDALASALRAVDKAPEVASVHLTLGDVLRSRGDKAAAQAEYDQAAQLKSAEL